MACIGIEFESIELASFSRYKKKYKWCINPPHNHISSGAPADKRQGISTSTHSSTPILRDLLPKFGALFSSTVPFEVDASFILIDWPKKCFHEQPCRQLLVQCTHVSIFSFKRSLLWELRLIKLLLQVDSSSVWLVAMIWTWWLS